MSDLITWLRQQLDDDERELLAGLADHLGSFPENDFRFRLAEVKAKRALIDVIVEYEQTVSGDSGFTIGELAGSSALLLLAQPYAGRDGWRDEWREEWQFDV